MWKAILRPVFRLAAVLLSLLMKSLLGLILYAQQKMSEEMLPGHKTVVILLSASQNKIVDDNSRGGTSHTRAMELMSEQEAWLKDQGCDYTTLGYILMPPEKVRGRQYMSIPDMRYGVPFIFNGEDATKNAALFKLFWANEL
jgi:hypothetical protein